MHLGLILFSGFNFGFDAAQFQHCRRWIACLFFSHPSSVLQPLVQIGIHSFPVIQVVKYRSVDLLCVEGGKSLSQFRWRQLSNSGAPSDHWAIDHVSITTGPVAPLIVSQPQNGTVTVGGTASFNATATGTAPLAYQWQRGGLDLAGKTNSSLVINNAQLSDAGTYDVVVTNSAGTAISSNATLVVNVPAVCTPPASGLVSWWKGETNASDQADGNNGTLILQDTNAIVPNAFYRVRAQK